ncbi:MAG: hypothetical protein ACRDHZ_20860 [Ktedonobacteraceae bacterium]
MKYAASAVFAALLALPAMAQGPAGAAGNNNSQTTSALVTTNAAPQQMKPCLIVRQAEGHRFRNSMIAGALTGGVGFAVGAASGGAKYEYVDSFSMPSTKLKYKGSELQKLQQSGVHVVTVNKKATGEELHDARESCKEQ